MAAETFSWRVSCRGGGFGEEVWFEADSETAEVLRDLWGQIERCAPGVRRSALLRDMRLLMDVAASFPGGTLRASESRSEGREGVPLYLAAPAAENGSESLAEPCDEQMALAVRRVEPDSRLTPA